MLRAAQLAADPSRLVALVVPWLPPEEQPQIFPRGMVFDSPEAQAAYVRDEARAKSGLACDEANFQVAARVPGGWERGGGPHSFWPQFLSMLASPNPYHSTTQNAPPPVQIVFYSAKYFAPLGSLFPTEDIAALVPRDQVHARPSWFVGREAGVRGELGDGACVLGPGGGGGAINKALPHLPAPLPLVPVPPGPLPPPVPPPLCCLLLQYSAVILEEPEHLAWFAHQT